MSISLYATYLSNVYFQTYVNGLSPILVPVLSVAFGISSASIATYLYLGMKRIRTIKEVEIPVKKRLQPKKTPRRTPQISISQHKATELPPTSSAKLKPIGPSQTDAQLQKPPPKGREDSPSSTGTRKQ